MAGRTTRGEGWELIRAGGGGGESAASRSRSVPPAEQKIRVQEEKRAKGKMVTVARGFRLTADELAALAKRLKTVCGAGGKADDDAIEIQGRHRDKLAAALRDAGYAVR